MRIKKALAALSLILLPFALVACSSDDGDDEDSSGSSTTETADSDSSSDDESTSTEESEADAVDLPDGWPDELELPDGTTVIEVVEPSETSMTVIATIDGDTEAVYDALLAQLTDAGYTIVGNTFTPSDEGGFGSISAEGDEYTVAIAFGPDATGDTSQVTLNVAEVTS